MSRLYDALCQAGLPKIFDPEVAPPDSSLVDVREIPDFTNMDELPDIADDNEVLVQNQVPSVVSRSLAWGNIGSFHPDPAPEARLVALSDTADLGAEKFRLLRSRLRHLKSQTKIKSIVITSAVPEDGKSFVALNLAISLSQHTQEKVLVIEGDLHKPVFAGRIGLPVGPGLGEWLNSKTPIEKHMYRMGDSTLWILPAGVSRKHPLGLLQSTRFSESLELLRKSFDWILIDAPPLLPLADVNYWSQQSDGILLVVRQGRTPATLLKKGLETLDSARTLGVVLNDADTADRAYYERYYHHDNVLVTSGPIQHDE